LVESGVWSDGSVEIVIWFIVGCWLAAFILGGTIFYDTQTLLREYTKDLARDGLYVEFRIAEVGKSSWSGEATYLYLFPLNNANKNTARALPTSRIGSIAQRGDSRNNGTDIA
jgi:hypothetical protein